MAQSYTPGTDPETGDAPDAKKPGFHYYSGGEVKELEHTNVSPLLWGFWSLVILGAVGYLIFGGALGPNSPLGGFKPAGGSAASQAMIQADVDQRARGGNGLKAADMAQLKPFLGTESLNQAVSNGANIYQNYCIGCHGPNQDGNGVNAASLNPKPRNLHDAPFMRETLTYDRINNSLHYGVHGTAMPRWENTLSEREIQEVISYALSLTWTMPPASNMDTTTSQLATPAKAPAPSSPAASNPAAKNPALAGPREPAAGLATGPAGAATTQSGTAKQTAGLAAPGKSVTGSTTGTAGGSLVRGGSVQTSPAPLTPTIDGNPAAATSTSPPSASGSTAPVTR